MSAKLSVIHSNPNIMGGVPVLVGTRVPVRNSMDYLAAGDPLAAFLEEFPTVTAEQAASALREAAGLWESHARSTPRKGFAS